MVCERLLQGIQFEVMTTDINMVETRLINVFMLVKLYMRIGNPQRVLRLLSENTKQNLYLKDLLDKLSKEP
jgi:hypothetical protein